MHSVTPMTIKYKCALQFSCQLIRDIFIDIAWLYIVHIVLNHAQYSLNVSLWKKLKEFYLR